MAAITLDAVQKTFGVGKIGFVALANVKSYYRR